MKPCTPSKYSTFTENAQCAGCSARHRGWLRKKSSSLPCLVAQTEYSEKQKEDVGGNDYWTHLLSCSDYGRILKKDHKIIWGDWAGVWQSLNSKYQFLKVLPTLSLVLGNLETAQVLSFSQAPASASLPCSPSLPLPPFYFCSTLPAATKTSVKCLAAMVSPRDIWGPAKVLPQPIISGGSGLNLPHLFWFHLHVSGPITSTLVLALHFLVDTYDSKKD